VEEGVLEGLKVMEVIQAMLEQRVLQEHRVTQVLVAPQAQEIQEAQVTQAPQAIQDLGVIQVRELLMEVLVNRGRLEILG
jgi:hypothetical protein